MIFLMTTKTNNSILDLLSLPFHTFYSQFLSLSDRIDSIRKAINANPKLLTIPTLDWLL
jgi:hypothetical protein